MQMNDTVFFEDEPMVFHLTGLESAHQHFRFLSR
jgi:hypothetical protein